jgi:hypothetical protein
MLTEYISIVSSQSVTFIVITLGAKYANVYFGFNDFAERVRKISM